MRIALWLLSIQGLIGAFDTLYYHEWRARLPARGRAAASELKIQRPATFFTLFFLDPYPGWSGKECL